jgi:protein-S-isoprenylcysteine O-methyltransferase Ste14
MEALQYYLDNINQVIRKTIPPVYFLISILLMFIVSYLMPLSYLIYLPLRVFGGLLILLGLGMITWCAYSYKQAGTPIKPFEKSTILVKDGCYRFSRNPMYLGMVIILIGTWIALGTFSPVLVIPVFIYIIQAGFIIYEEQLLVKWFGDDYLDYQEKVRRWL